MQKLEFGTAGIRGVLGKGEHFLNIYHIYRVADGYSKYLKNKFPNKKNLSVVIGRDNRYESHNFAKAAAAVLDLYGIKVYFSKDIIPTPFLSFAIKELAADGGINITASHNPKEFNGIKVYNQYGAQILPEEVDELVPYFKKYNFYLNKNYIFSYKNNIQSIPKKIYSSYENKALLLGPDNSDCSNISVAFSPLHGTGAKLGRNLLNKLTKKAFFVEKEMINNRHFTYVKSPNPENASAYEGVIKLGIEHKCDIVLLTDPDADRVGLGVYDKSSNSYKLLNGNDTATLIFKYLIDTTSIDKLKNSYLIYSFVSTTLPKMMAEKNSIKTFDIATGFKWVAKVVNEQKLNQKMLFAFEESYGSLIDNSLSFDKDAIQSIVILVKMASYYKKNNLSLIDVLNEIYKEYGYIKSESIMIDLDPKDPVNQLKRLKSAFKNAEFKISKKNILDYNKGIFNIPINDMIKINFVDDSWIALRPSGTEPKIKFYIFAVDKTIEKVENKFLKFKKVIQGL